MILKPVFRIALLTLAVLLSFVALFAQTKKPASKSKAPAAQPAALKASVARGKAVYDMYCVVCHQADGAGVPAMNPPLKKSSAVAGQKAPLINIILNGMEGQKIKGESYSNSMASHSFLSDEEVADVLNYVRNSFGNKGSIVTPAEVMAIRNKK